MLTLLFLAEKLKQRKRFSYSKLDAIFGIFCCVKRRFGCWKGPYRNNKYYNEAKDKLSNDLDVMNIVSTVNKVKVLVDVLLNNRQKQLLNLSEVHTVHDKKSEENDLDEIWSYKSKKNKSKKAEFEDKIDGMNSGNKKSVISIVYFLIIHHLESK